MQISVSELKTARGKVVGIGRVKFPKTSWFNHEIPLLSFIVIKKPNGKYVSTCIHLKMDGYGDTVKSAQSDMAENIWNFLDRIFNNKNSKNKCWLNMYELSKGDEISTTLWDKYHAVQFMLAEKGVATDRYTQLQSKIAELENKVKELEKRIKKKINDAERRESISDIVRSTTVEYIPTTEAA